VARSAISPEVPARQKAAQKPIWQDYKGSVSCPAGQKKQPIWQDYKGSVSRPAGQKKQPIWLVRWLHPAMFRSPVKPLV
jgi:hypothetical protein